MDLYSRSAVQAAPPPSFLRYLDANLGESDEDFSGCRCIDDVYERVSKLGEGGYSKVFLVRDKVSGEMVAAKKVILEADKAERREEGFFITTIREIKLLMELEHINIINLREVVRSRPVPGAPPGSGAIYLVMDFMDHDLDALSRQLYDQGGQFTPEQVKCIAKQLLEGLAHCHSHHIIHRDLKPSNLLMDREGRLKIADFGLARNYNPEVNTGKLTPGVVTLWYRAPEVLLGDSYSSAIDMWSAGLIIAELALKKRVLLQGTSDADQIAKIMDLFGAITRTSYPDCEQLPLWKSINASNFTIRGKLAELISGLPKDLQELLAALLQLDPRKRLSASDALDSEYFHSDPAPCRPDELPQMQLASHEWASKRKEEAMKLKALSAAKRPRVEGAAAAAQAAGPGAGAGRGQGGRGRGRGKYVYEDLDA